jgi:hypothetical protein
MDFQPASQNGVIPPSELGTLHSRFGTLISTTSTVYGRPVIIKAISDAAMYKTEPVSFYTQYTTGSVTTTVLLGESQFIKTEYAALVTTALGTGTHQVYATWPGEGKYAAVSTITAPITVSVASGYPLGAPIVLTPDHPTNTVIAGDATPITFTASITTGTQLVGNVIFYKDHIEIGTGQLQNNYSGSYVASITINDLSGGDHVITAVWPGSTIGGVNYQGLTTDLAYSVLRGRTITQPMTLTLDPSHGIVGEGQINITAAISTTTQLPGTVYFSVDGMDLYNTPFVNNAATISIPNTYALGDHSFTARWDGNQSGTPKYIEKATTSTWTEYARENPGELTVTTQPADHNAFAYDTVLVGTFSTSTSVQGTVLFFDQFAAIGSAPIVNNSATFVSHGLSTGTHLIQAYYGGSATAPKYYSALSSTATLLITEGVEIPANITMDVTNDSYAGIRTPYIIGETQTITASISTSTSLVGAVEFYANNQLVGLGNWSGNQASVNTVFNATGTQVVRAHWPGQSIGGTFYSTKDSLTASVTLLPGYTLTPPITLSAPGPKVYNQPVTLFANVSTSSSMANGVDFYVNNSFVGTGNFNPTTNSATLVTNVFTTTGNYLLSGHWTGGYIDDHRLYLGKDTNTASITVVEALTFPGALTLSSTPAYQFSTTSVTLSSNFGNTLTGTIVYKEYVYDNNQYTFVTTATTSVPTYSEPGTLADYGGGNAAATPIGFATKQPFSIGPTHYPGGDATVKIYSPDLNFTTYAYVESHYYETSYYGIQPFWNTLFVPLSGLGKDGKLNVFELLYNHYWPLATIDDPSITDPAQQSRLRQAAIDDYDKALKRLQFSIGSYQSNSSFGQLKYVSTLTTSTYTTTLRVRPVDFFVTNSSTHKVQVEWLGGNIDGVRYFGTSSNTATMAVTTASIQFGPKFVVGQESQYQQKPYSSQLVFTATFNTSTMDSVALQLMDNGVPVQTSTVVGNSATWVLSPNTLPIGEHRLYAQYSGHSTVTSNVSIWKITSA